jgi:hypothetical protein
MLKSLPRPVWFALSFVICVYLYLPGLGGGPIWDDYSFWFSDPIMRPDFPYLKIWTDFAWPFSVSHQKFLLSAFGEEFIYYHVFNLFIHFINSLLVYKLGDVLKLRNKFLFFLLFLIHPTCVIAVAWMIQLKTLLCMMFALLSILTYLKGLKKKPWLILSWIAFFLSAASKSASLVLPIVLILLVGRRLKGKEWLTLIPMILISLFGTYKTLSSKITLEGVEKAEKMTALKTETKDAPLEVPKAPEKPKLTQPAKPKAEVDQSLKKETPAPAPAPVDKEPNAIEPVSEATLPRWIKLDLGFISQNLYYYFWQALIPIRNEPVKGPNLKRAGIPEMIHLFFLLTIVVIFWRRKPLYLIAIAHVMLLPFLGIIKAPYMNVTWVSDQHLYLVLPALLAFWVMIFDKLNFKGAKILPIFLILFYSYKTREITPVYDSQQTFYEVSLEYNPYNVPLTYNLAFVYAFNQEPGKAITLLEEIMSLAEEEPSLKKNIYWHHIPTFHDRLNHGGQF